MRKSEERWQCWWWFLTPCSPGYLFPGLRLAMETGGEEWGCKCKYCSTGMTDNERTGQGTGSYSSVSQDTHTVAAGRVEPITFMSLEVSPLSSTKSKLKQNLYHYYYYYCIVCSHYRETNQHNFLSNGKKASILKRWSHWQTPESFDLNSSL